MDNKLPKRKIIRLKKFDYSKFGIYFITICTHNRQQLFAIRSNFEDENLYADLESDAVGADSISARLAEKVLFEVVEKYSHIECPYYVIMPDHIHLLIAIGRADMESAPTIIEILQEFKRYYTVKYIEYVKAGKLPPFEKKIWQRSYFDHVIRDEEEYRAYIRYMYENPMKWKYDKKNHDDME